ncbi:MAG: hypothetical protein U0Q19_10130 [Kineosporiaceae bacterium]
MCAPTCCPSPAVVAGRSGAGGGVVVLALVVVAGAVFAALFGWPTVLLCLVAAVVTTGAALWGIAVLAYRVNRALYGPDLATVSPAQPEGPVRVRATATDLPDPSPVPRLDRHATGADGRGRGDDRPPFPQQSPTHAALSRIPRGAAVAARPGGLLAWAA